MAGEIRRKNFKVSHPVVCPGRHLCPPPPVVFTGRHLCPPPPVVCPERHITTDSKKDWHVCGDGGCYYWAGWRGDCARPAGVSLEIQRHIHLSEGIYRTLTVSSHTSNNSTANNVIYLLRIETMYTILKNRIYNDHATKRLWRQLEYILAYEIRLRTIQSPSFVLNDNFQPASIIVTIWGFWSKLLPT